MDYYQSIILLDDFKFRSYTLLAALYGKLHLAMAMQNRNDIGVSFPEYGNGLGNIIRLHGTYTALKALNASGWVQGTDDICQIKEILPVPYVEYWRVVKGVLPLCSKGNHRFTEYVEPDKQYPKALNRQSGQATLKMPSLIVKSMETNSKTFRLYISHGEPRKKPVNGIFTSYGLSDSATIPWF